jgi:disulfide bond formation protein DsbB
MLTRNPYILLLLLASFCLFSAYFVEYIIQLAPCPLCIYQRFPYLIFIFVSIIAIAGKEYKACNTYYDESYPYFCVVVVQKHFYTLIIIIYCLLRTFIFSDFRNSWFRGLFVPPVVWTYYNIQLEIA